MKETGVVITAAGTGERSRVQKPLQKVDGVAIAARLVVCFQRAGIKNIVIVTGQQEEELKKELRGFGVTFLHLSSDDKREQLDAVRVGLKYLQESCEQFFICPVEVSFFTEETVRKLLESNADIAIPSFRKHAGHPVLVSGRWVSDIIEYCGKDGLRGAIRTLPIAPSYVEVEDKGIRIRADEPQEMSKLSKQHTETRIRAQVKVRLVKESPFFGPGTVTLLKQISVLDSVREASEKTGISYSKAWTMIREAERQTGRTLVNRQPGGKYGGTAQVTEYGKIFIEKYEELERRVEQYTEEQFRDIFK